EGVAARASEASRRGRRHGDRADEPRHRRHRAHLRARDPRESRPHPARRAAREPARVVPAREADHDRDRGRAARAVRRGGRRRARPASADVVDRRIDVCDRRGRGRGAQAAARARPHDRERSARGDHSASVSGAAMSARITSAGAFAALAHAFRLGWSETWAQRSALLGTFVNYAVILSLWANLYRQLHPQSLARASLGYAQVVWYLALTELVA